MGSAGQPGRPPAVLDACRRPCAQYEEIWAPEVKDFVYISDRAYTKEQILQMEKLMLNELAFHLTVPTIYPFLHRFIKVTAAAPAPSRTA